MLRMKVRLPGNRIFLGLLILALLFLVPGSFANSPSGAQAAPSDKLDQVNKKLKDTRKVIKKSKVQEKELVRTTRVIDQKIVTLETDLDQLSDKLDTATEERMSAQERLEALAERLAKVQRRLRMAESEVLRTGEVLNTRLVSMYKAGDANYFDVLLGADSFNDFVARVSFLQMISVHDRQILSEKMTSRDEVRRLERLVLENKAEARAEARTMIAREQRIESLREQTESRQGALQSEKESKDEVLAKVVKKRKDAEALEDLLEEESKNIQAWLASQGASSVPVSAGGFIVPVVGPVTSEFGYRIHPISGRRKLHEGMDIGAPNGSPIHAAKSGRVIVSGWRGGYGQAVIIDHGGGVVTLYGHASRLLVSVGQSVTRGQTIALVGSTGASTGNHLHWEVRVNGVAKNPRNYL